MERAGTLIDDYLPRFDAREHHAIVVNAAPERVWSVLRSAPIGGGIVRLLLTIRALGTRRLSMPTLDQLIAQGDFGLVAEAPPRELLLGIEGPFWQPRCRPRAATAETFRSPLPPNTARAAWNFALEPLDASRTRLTTETRVLCADAASRRKFRLYWFFIRPGSGLIRWMMLRSIRGACSRQSD